MSRSGPRVKEESARALVREHFFLDAHPRKQTGAMRRCGRGRTPM
jgi:hypothetical protein